MQTLRRHSALALHGHRNGYGALSRHPLLGFSFQAWQTLWRLAGVDHMHVHGLQGKFSQTDDEVIASAHDTLTPLCEGLDDRVLHAFSNCQWAGTVPATWDSIRSNDLLFMSGGGILAHPDGPAAGIASLGCRAARPNPGTARSPGPRAATCPAILRQKMTSPTYGWYGDDFTGATDTLAVLAQAGLRAMAPDAMHAELTDVGHFFRRVAPPVLHYKVCSTFDSAVQVGNIACAIQALRPAVDHRWVPIVGGQPSLGRYCAFSHLFAAAGTGGSVHRIDRHPTMRQHPVTPMAESDLRLHLGRQGMAHISALHFPDYDSPADVLDAKLQALQAQHAADAPLCPTLLDLTSPQQLATIGRLLWQHAQQARLLAVGSSAVAQALVAHWKGPQPSAPVAQAPLQRAPGPVFAWAGSLSPLTAAQVAAASDYQRIAVDAQQLCSDPACAPALLDTIGTALHHGHHVLAYTAPTDGRTAQLASAQLVAQVVQQQTRQGRPLRRLGIAGGDTSSHAVQALQLWGLSYSGLLCPGVALSQAHSADPARDGMELMLKGGQMGGEDLLQQLLGR